MKTTIFFVAAFLVATAQAKGPREMKSVTEATGSHGRPVEWLKESVKNERDPELKKAMVETIKTLDRVSETEATKRVERLFESAKGNPEEIYRHAVDVFSRDHDAVRLDGEKPSFNPESVVGKFFSERAGKVRQENRLGNASDTERLSEMATLAKFDTDVMEVAFKTADRLQREDSESNRGTANSSAPYLKELLKMADYVNKAINGGDIGKKDEDGGKVSFKSPKAKERAFKVKATIQEIAKDSAAIGKSPSALRAQLESLGKYFKELASDDEAIASSAEKAIYGLASTYRTGVKGMVRDFTAIREGKALEDVIITGLDGKVTKINAETMKIPPDVVAKIEPLMQEILKGIDLERPMVEVIAQIKERLEARGITSADAEKYLDLFRARGTGEIIKRLVELEKSGKFAPEKDVIQKFACAAGCMPDLAVGVLTQVFGAGCVPPGSKGGPAAPGKDAHATGAAKPAAVGTGNGDL